MYATFAKGPRYLEIAKGEITRVAIEDDGTIIGYELMDCGKMMDDIKKGAEANEALAKAKGNYGRFADAVK